MNGKISNDKAMGKWTSFFRKLVTLFHTIYLEKKNHNCLKNFKVLP